MKSSFRVGHGIDVHRLVPDRKLILAGVEIPHTFGLAGHSDADVVTHAVIDALLGASGKDDIGSFFPDTESKWKDANSLEMLKIIHEMLKSEGFSLVNVDICIQAEKPKLRPYIQQMKEKLAAALEVQVGCCSIKAGTNEGLGYLGREEGIQASAVVLLSHDQV